MNLLSWNCRGIGNPRAVQDLRLLVKEKQPTLLFLMEMRAKNKKLQAIRRSLGFEDMFFVDPGLVGALLCFGRTMGRCRFRTTLFDTSMLLLNCWVSTLNGM
jgi:hypothetical protein